MSLPDSTKRPSGISTILSYGFRPFFLLGAIDAVLLIGLWVPWFLGLISVPSQFTPVVWHAHELLFGFVPAIIAGFVLTAIATWTSRPPVAGRLLAILVFLWLAGRLVVAVSHGTDELLVAVICLLFPIALCLVVTREVAMAGNQRNIKVAVLIGAIAVAQAAFHYEAWLTGRAKLSIALATSLILIMIMVIAGRIIPSFTSNWLKANRPGALPQQFAAFDIVANSISAAALAGWIASKTAHTTPGVSFSTAALLFAAAAANIARQLRWRPLRTFSEPLVAILHIAYLFVPIGFAFVGAAVLVGDAGLETAGLHAWTTGAFGTMILAVMTRVTRGHTGNVLTAPWSTVAIYACIVPSASIRIAAAMVPEKTLVLIPVAGVLWIAAFTAFVLFYGRMLLTPRRPV